VESWIMPPRISVVRQTSFKATGIGAEDGAAGTLFGLGLALFN
jgi:hypothetical protein